MAGTAQQLIEYSEPDARVALPGPAGTDPWIIEVLLDTLAAALHLPLRLIIAPRLEHAFLPGEPLGDTIRTGFGEIAVFRSELRAIASDAQHGSKRIQNEPIWEEIDKQITALRAVITSNSDPFWTVMRALDSVGTWDLLWLLNEGDVTAAGEGIIHLPEPFGTDFIVCRTSTRKFSFRLVGGPVWHWVSGSCSETGVAPNGNAAVERITQAFDDDIRRHRRGVAEGAPVGSFSEERLMRNIMGRPPMFSADVRRRVHLASRALEHALRVETDRPPRAPELVSIAISALHLAERQDAASARFGPGAEVWHRLETACVAGSSEPSWLSTGLVGDRERIEVGASRLHAGPPPAVGGAIHAFDMTIDSADPDELALSHLMVDYAIGRSAYIRERMMIVRLWARDNFARWLTTANLPKKLAYTERVDALAFRIGNVFAADRCSIFRYDAEARTLDRLGRSSKKQAGDDAERRPTSYEEIRAAGPDPERRDVSPRYRAIDEARPVSLTEFRDDPRRPEGRRIGSRLVVPIVVFGRPWGAIELVGLRSHQFLPSTTTWLDEYGKLLGPDLYVEGILNDLHEISRSVLAKKPTKRAQFQDVISRLARIFIAGSGALYLQHSRRTSEFVCASYFGRPGDQPDGKLSGFNIEDPVSKAALFLRGEREEWLAGVIGSAPFDGDWVARAKTQALKADGYRFIAMMPLRDGNDHVVGCITLAAREGGPFEERFRPLAEFATRYAGVAIEAIKLQHQPDESVRELMAHSLKTRVDRVAGTANTLELLLASFFGEAGDAGRVGSLLQDIEREAARHRWAIDGTDRSGKDVLHALQQAFDIKGQSSFPTLLNDLRIHSSDLRHTAAFLAGDAGNAENPYETTDALWTGTPTALRDCLLGSVKAVARTRGVGVLTPPPQELGFEVRIRVSPLVMSDMINNFCDNAIKYSSSGTPSRVRFRWNKGSSAYLEFRNLAPRLTDDELAKLGVPGFRSRYAISRSSDGQGRGLTSNRQLAGRWRMKVIHRQEPTEKDLGVDVWQVFGLEIPGDLIFEDAIERQLERGRRP